MNRTAIGNTAGLVVTLGLAMAAAWLPGRSSGVAAHVQPAAGLPARRRIDLPGGGQGLVDASGQTVAIAPFRRIVSTDLVTDRLLVELCEPDRIAAFSGAGVRGSQRAFQYAGKPAVEGLGPIESLLVLKPDLVLLHTWGAAGRIAKLRAAGIAVFDLGDLRGLSTLLSSAETLADLLGQPDRGRAFTTSFGRRMQAVAAPLGARPRRTALYLAAVGPGLYGGTAGTSYHDVLTHAGLVDVAASDFADWPRYSAEQVLGMAPDLLVTKADMGAVICRYPGLHRLAACGDRARLIELPAALLDEPGPAMLDAAEALFASAYPDVTSATPGRR